MATAKAVKAWSLCEIAQEEMLVTRKKIDVPVESDTKTGFRLVVGCRAMGIEDSEIEPPRQLTEQRRMVLDWMGGDDRQMHYIKDPSSDKLLHSGVQRQS